MAFTMSVAELISSDTSGLLGKHPSWERVALREVASVLNGAPFNSALFSGTGGTPLVRIRDVIAGQTSTYYTGPYEEIYLVRAGDLLVGMDGDFHSAFWRAEESLLNQRVCKIAANDDLYDARLLSLVLPGYLGAINANTPSVTVKHLSSRTIESIDLPLPPRAEQTRIVAKLEELLSELDAGVAELKAAQRKLARYRQSLLKAAVEGALTAEWRQQHTPAESGAQLLERILAERRARWEAKQLAKFKEQGKTPPKDWQRKYPEPVKPDTTNLPELPEGWVWASVDCLLSDIQTGKSFKCTERPPTLGETGVVKVSAVSWGEYDEQESKTCTKDELINPELIIRTGDFLFSRANTVELVGACVIAGATSLEVMLSDKILRLVFLHEYLKPWALYVLRSQIGRRQIELLASGNQESMKNIGQERLRSIAVPLGPRAEIEVAIEVVDQTTKSSSQQERAIERSLKQATAQRQNILRAAFAGELVPQDANDEPASVLLERIRAERALAESSIKGRKGRTAKEKG